MQIILPSHKEEQSKFCWNEECEAAFQDLKKFLASLSLLSKLVTRETLFLYLAVSESAVSGALTREEWAFKSLCTTLLRQ